MKRELRLKRLLLQHLEELGSISALARAITAANSRARGLPEDEKRPLAVNRLKLTNFLKKNRPEKGWDVSISLSELEALDDFLNEHHQGLAFVPIFERLTLLETLVALREVHFLIGVRDIQGLISVSHLDMLAFEALSHHLNHPSPGVTCMLEHVHLSATRDGARRLQGETWQRTLSTESAVVSIASPLSNHGTELMLAQMFGCPAYEEPSQTRQHPEIALVLPEPYQSDAFSSFVERPEDLEDRTKAARIHDRCWALRVGKDVFVAEEDQPRGKTYGLIAAQRRADGYVRVVAAGLHGAGTHAAALALPGADISLGSGRQGEDGQVHVRVVEARVTYTTSPRGTPIDVVEHQRILKNKWSFGRSRIF